MKPLHLLIGLLVLLASSSCSDSIEEPIPGQGENAGSTDVYHDYVRQNPYPKADNELFLNPPPLIVPEQMKGPVNSSGSPFRAASISIRKRR